jgi:sulfur transfer protein SufE
MTWPPALQEVIDEFSEIEDAMERLEVLMDFAEEVDELSEEEWSDENLVKGCQSRAHVVLEKRDNTIWMRAAADSKMVQGLMGILTIAVNGGTVEQVLELTPDFVLEMKVLNTLTPSRSNGFRTMFDMIQKTVKEMK